MKKNHIIKSSNYQIIKFLLLIAVPFGGLGWACNKPFDDGLLQELHKKTRLSKLVTFTTNYSYNQRDYYELANTDWYDMYQCIYNDENPRYLGRLYYGSGSITYGGLPSKAAFDPHDEQSYFELTTHIERFFNTTYRTSDSTIGAVKYKAATIWQSQQGISDSLIFTTEQPWLYNNFKQVDVLQIVDLW